MAAARVWLAAAAAVAAAVRLTSPAMPEAVLMELARIYVAARDWLTLPHLYVLINGIIISIAASSHFHNLGSSEELADAAAPPAVEFQIGDDGGGEKGKSPGNDGLVVVLDGDEEDFVISRSDWTPPSRRIADEKPLLSERFGGRRSIRSSPDGRPLGVAKQKKGETLESTWKTITEGRGMPLGRHLRTTTMTTTPVAARKGENIGETRKATSSPVATVGRMIRREASPGQEELNRRVEAFINKFNEEMRLQRQNSFKHYMDLVNQPGQQ
ncbi:uncharacterized protein LOC144707838 [Wolffia australiana]